MSDTEQEPQPELTEGEELGLVVAGVINRLTNEKARATSWAVVLEQDLAKAVETIQGLLKEWPETSWAHDSLAKEQAAVTLAELTDPERVREWTTLGAPESQE